LLDPPAERFAVQSLRARMKIELPTVSRLRMILDPEGLIFSGKYDFDKFFELAGKGQSKISN